MDRPCFCVRSSVGKLLHWLVIFPALRTRQPRPPGPGPDLSKVWPKASPPRCVKEGNERSLSVSRGWQLPPRPAKGFWHRYSRVRAW